VLAIALPQARVTLIERKAAKCRFLREATAKLGLANVEIVEGNAQHWLGGAEAFDVVTSRKVGRLDTMLGLSAPLLAPGGAVALWPGLRDFRESPDAAADAAQAAGLRLTQIHPIESERRGNRIVKHLYLYEKIDER
jgi:16S rRNA (guanine527-N7)-methyltransferase